MSAVPDTRTHPATYRQVFASGEFTAVFAAGTLSWIGDYLARAALTFLVYERTGGSVLLAACAFAVGYLPSIVGGPIIAAWAEHHPARQVMIGTDLGRLLLIGLMAVPGLPVPALFGLLFAATLLTPAFGAARSALLPELLPGDRYVVGVSVSGTVNQLAQLAGYGLGGAVAGIDPRLALLVDAATFGASAALVRWRVRARPAPRKQDRQSLPRATRAGFTLVFGHPVLRCIALMLVVGTMSSIVPEALAVGWARQLGDGPGAQSLIMAAGPFGMAVGTAVMSRLLAPELRRRLVRPVVVGLSLVLVPALAHPPLPVVLAMTILTGLALGALLPPTNGMFVATVPPDHRMRAFAVLGAALQVGQLLGAVGVAGLAEGSGDVADTIGVWGLAGTVLSLLVVAAWPTGAAAPSEEADR